WAIPNGPWSSRSWGAEAGASAPPSRAARAASAAPAFMNPRRLITGGSLEGRPQPESYMSSGGEAFDAVDRSFPENGRLSIVEVAVLQEAVELHEAGPVPDEELRVVEGVVEERRELHLHAVARHDVLVEGEV